MGGQLSNIKAWLPWVFALLFSAGVALATAHSRCEGDNCTFVGWMQANNAGSGSNQTRGQITLSTGTGTATVLTNAFCVCSEATDATKTVKCAVSSTTLTATGTGSDVITYVCL